MDGLVTQVWLIRPATLYDELQGQRFRIPAAALASESGAGQSESEPKDGVVVNFVGQLGRPWYPDIWANTSTYLSMKCFEMGLTFTSVDSP